MEQLIAGGLAVFIGGFVQGCIGFGFGMISLPILLFFFAASTIVPLIAMLGIVNNLYVLYHCRHDVRPWLVLGLWAGAALGMPLGVLFLKTLDGPAIKVFVGALMVVLAAIMISGWQRPVKRLGPAAPPVGMLSGFFGGSTSLAGPPVILFLANQSVPKNQFRATLVAYFAGLAVYALIVFRLNGMLSIDLVKIWLGYLPLIVLGTIAGVRLGDRIPEPRFARLVIICAGFMGVLLVVANALKL